MATNDPSHPGGPQDLPPDDQSKSDELLKRLRSRPSLAGERYRFVEEAGRGGMGAVLRVRDLDLHRNLAMKVILGQATDAPKGGDTPPVDPEVLQRFLHEAKITGQLEHPGVVPVHELGIDDQQRVYFTMRLVKGSTVDQVFAMARAGEDGWTRTRALEVVLKVCDTMAFAHGKKVLHRDLKPSNVMVGRFGEVYVMDWGLAKVAGEPERRDLRLREPPTVSRVRLGDGDDAGGADSPLITVDGAVVGTPCYMSLEQAEGRIEELDVRTDVYSVGAMLYELLAGRPPYVNPGARVGARTLLAAVLHGPPARLASLDPSIPAELVAVCEKAMARDKGQRYAGMAELADDLRAFLDRRVVRAYRTGARAEMAMWIRRNRALAAASAAAVLLLVAGAVASTAFALESARSFRELEHSSYIANIQMADKYLGLGEFAQARARLVACPEALRRWEWGHLSAESDHSLLHLPGETSPQLAPDGSFFVTRTEHGAVRVRDVATGALLRTLDGPGTDLSCVVLSADGKTLLVASGARVRVWDPATWTVRSEGEVGGTAYDPTLSHDGAFFVAAATNRMRGLWETSTWRCLRELGSDSFDRCVFAPGDAILAVSTLEGTEFLDVASGALVQKRADCRVHDPLVFSSDGRWLLDRGKTTRLVDVSTWTETELKGPSLPSCAAFSSDGTKVVTCDLDLQVRVWEVPSGKCVWATDGHEDFIWTVAWSPDGTRIATAASDHSPRILDWAQDASFRLTGHEESVRSLAWTPDSRRLVTGASDGTRIWDAAIVQRPRVHTVSRDGRLALGMVGKSVPVTDGGPVPGRPDLLPDRDAYVVDTATGGILHRLATPIFDAVFSSNDARIATADSKENIRVWEALTGAPAAVQVHGAWSVAFDAPAARLACGHEDGTVSVWDVQSGACLATKVAHAKQVGSVAFDPSGRRIVSTSLDGTARVWDASNLGQLGALDAHSARLHSVTWSADGAMVGTMSADGTAQVWNATTFALLVQMPCNEDPLGSVAFSPDGVHVAVPNGKVCELWCIADRRRELPLSGHRDLVVFAAFSPDGSRVVTSSQDGTARVWDVESGMNLVELKANGNSSTRAWFTSDGESVVTQDPSGAAQIWCDTPYRDRFPAIEAARSAITTMKARLHPRLDAGEAADALRASTASDASLSRDERVGAQIAITQWIDEHK